MQTPCYPERDSSHLGLVRTLAFSEDCDFVVVPRACPFQLLSTFCEESGTLLVNLPRYRYLPVSATPL